MSIHLTPFTQAGIVFTLLQGIIIWLKGPEYSRKPYIEMMEFWLKIIAHIVLAELYHVL